MTYPGEVRRAHFQFGWWVYLERASRSGTLFLDILALTDGSLATAKGSSDMTAQFCHVETTAAQSHRSRLLTRRCPRTIGCCHNFAS